MTTMLTAVTADFDESKLPRWDMKSLYGFEDLKDPSYVNEFGMLNQQAEEFKNMHYGKLDSDLLPRILKEYSEIDEHYRALDQFVGSYNSIHRDDPETLKLYSLYNTKRGEVHASSLEWVKLQLIRLPNEVVDRWLASTESAPFMKSIEPWLMELRKLRDHVLSEEVEQALTIRDSWYGTSPVVEYFTNMLTQARYPDPTKLPFPLQPAAIRQAFAGETPPTLTESRLLSYMLSEKRELRHSALALLNVGLSVNKINQFSCLSLNHVAGKEAIENKQRGWPKMRSARNLSNQLPDEVVDALIRAVKTVGVRINKRFYLLKRKILQTKDPQMDSFTWADRNAPLMLTTNSDGSDSAPPRHEWSECVAMIRESFGEFSTTFRDMFNDLVQEGRIDAPASHGKRGGAFCMLGTARVGPVVFTNYLGRDEDVATVAHECGHAIHGRLTYQQPFLMQDPATAIAEVASIFGEMLVFKKILRRAETIDKQTQLNHLMNKLNAIMNTVVRQISFDRFEELVHTAKRDGGFVPAEEMSKFWRQTMEEFYGAEGEVFTSYEETENLWAYVPHFHELPFYVYSYAFADLTVGTLYSLYEKNVFPNYTSAIDVTRAAVGGSGYEGAGSFQDRFIRLLASGSSKAFVDMVKDFELDGASEQFWQTAFTDYIEPLLEMAEKLAQDL